MSKTSRRDFSLSSSADLSEIKKVSHLFSSPVPITHTTLVDEQEGRIRLIMGRHSRLFPFLRDRYLGVCHEFFREQPDNYLTRSPNLLECFASLGRNSEDVSRNNTQEWSTLEAEGSVAEILKEFLSILNHSIISPLNTTAQSSNSSAKSHGKAAEPKRLLSSTPFDKIRVSLSGISDILAEMSTFSSLSPIKNISLGNSCPSSKLVDNLFEEKPSKQALPLCDPRKESNQDKEFETDNSKDSPQNCLTQEKIICSIPLSSLTEDSSILKSKNKSIA